MELFYGGGGRSNPDFRYKVRIKRQDGTMEWCDNYPHQISFNNSDRYYIDWRDGGRGYDTGYAIFQFEWEEPAIMFALKFGAA